MATTNIEEHEERLRLSIDLLDRTGRFIEPQHVNLALARQATGAAGAPQGQSMGMAPTHGCINVLSRLMARYLPGTPFAGMLPPTTPAVPPNDPTAAAVALMENGSAGVAMARPKARGKASKLATAVESVQSRVALLEERGVALRAEVSKHLAQGQRQKALLALKRAKQTEKQAQQAQATALMLEQQMDSIENQAVTSQITEALAAAAKSSKKANKGLLSRAEGAVEDASELQDLASDVSAVWGELNNNGGGGLDDDDEALEAELAAMVAEGGVATPPPAVVSGVAAAAVRAMPAAPKNVPINAPVREVVVVTADAQATPASA